MAEMGSDYVIVFNGPVAVTPRAPASRAGPERPAESAFAPRAALVPVGVGGRAVPEMLAALLTAPTLRTSTEPVTKHVPYYPAPASPLPRPALAPASPLPRPGTAPGASASPATASPATASSAPILLRRRTAASRRAAAARRAPPAHAHVVPPHDEPPPGPSPEAAQYWKIGAGAAVLLALFGTVAYAYYRSGAPTLEFVSMRGCDGCRAMGDLLDYAGDDLAGAGVRVRRSDIKNAPAEWRVTSTPALVLRRGGRVVGAIKDKRVEVLLGAGAKAPEKLLRWARAKAGG